MKYVVVFSNEIEGLTMPYSCSVRYATVMEMTVRATVDPYASKTHYYETTGCGTYLLLEFDWGTYNIISADQPRRNIVYKTGNAVDQRRTGRGCV